MKEDQIYRAFLREMVYNGDSGIYSTETNGNETGGVKMDDLQQKVADLQAQKAAMEAQGSYDVNVYNQVINSLSEAQYELDQQQAKEQRDQKQQEVIEQAVDMLPTIFGALFPEEAYTKLLGPNQYADLQQSFYQIIRAYTSDQLQTLSSQHEQELAGKDDKIKTLTKQVLDVQQQLDSANHLVSTYEDQIKAEKDAHDQTQADLAATKSQLSSVQADSTAKDEKIAELQTKLDAAAQPKSAPSSNMQDLLTQIKSKSTFNPDDLVARFNARQKDDSVKLPTPEVPAASATFPSAEPQSSTVSNAPTEPAPAEVQPPTIDAPSFQGDVQAPSVPVAEGQSANENHQQTVEERLQALEARVTALEGKAS